MFFFKFCANVQQNVIWGIQLYITLPTSNCDSRLAAYGGVVLQRFEGLNYKDLYGNATVLLEKSILLVFCE